MPARSLKADRELPTHFHGCFPSLVIPTSCMPWKNTPYPSRLLQSKQLEWRIVHWSEAKNSCTVYPSDCIVRLAPTPIRYVLLWPEHDGLAKVIIGRK